MVVANGVISEGEREILHKREEKGRWERYIHRER